ncbi:MAG TPA: hypothetical protein VNC39_03110 [Acidocella sp.]|uniref:hypothetical protein n=1 Tax=Acidocella sp. TaxID=50710 RepID=UPI002C6F6AED|nr:hypothetical protein [Acidocella sp.]HVE20938.1 hypothetical protein [Acidocella sp.]
MDLPCIRLHTPPSAYTGVSFAAQDETPAMWVTAMPEARASHHHLKSRPSGLGDFQVAATVALASSYGDFAAT